MNNVSSPVLRSAIVSPLAAGAGHIAGGTTAGLINEQSFNVAFGNSFYGLGQSMAFGTAIGMASTIGVSYANKNSPFTGKPLNSTKQDLATTQELIDAFKIQKTLDRIENGERHFHRNDGTTFRNDKGYLPELKSGSYTEYVHPTEGLNHAGMQRVITGPSGEIYYTPDHYVTFIRIK